MMSPLIKIVGTVLCVVYSLIISEISHADAGGNLSSEQAAYDVRHYDLDLKVDVDRRSISGTVTVKAKILSPLKVFVLDLDASYKVSEVSILSKIDEKNLKFQHKDIQKPEGDGKQESALEFFGFRPFQDSQLWIKLDREYTKGEVVEISVTYRGTPPVASNPPFGSGFIWSKTEEGKPWIGTVVFFEGADVWWPVKDHPSDKPEEGVTLKFTTIDGLEVISNGRSMGKTHNADGTATHHSRVTTPIDAYNVTFNAGPYQKIQTNYQSVSGRSFPVSYWAVPENFQEAKRLFPQIIQNLNFLEMQLGPYPFQADKLDFLYTPHMGMEHQTVVAYNPKILQEVFGQGVNIIHGHHMTLFHELAHQWWGNLVSASDWRDIWLQESIAVYMEPLYMERLYGKQAYHEYIHRRSRGAITDSSIVASVESTVAAAFTFKDPPIHFAKGNLMLHSLRYLLGDDVFFKFLRYVNYPNRDAKDIQKMSQGRSISSAEFAALASEVSERDLDWFFDLYLRRPELPELLLKDQGNQLLIEWQVPKGLVFPMPIEIVHNGKACRIAMPNGKATIAKQPTDQILVDPDFWVLRKEKPNADLFGTLFKD